jgi:DNA repair protein RecN (Recombination protein N)
MLDELSITNFAIIDELHVSFGPHLNVFTGETGAGKSIIVDALSALVGERAGGDVVRAGAERAIVEGVFDIASLLNRGAADMTPPLKDGADGASETAESGSLAAVLAELGIESEDGTLILTREIQQNGRGIARVNRRAVPLSALQRIARFLIDIHGQSAHLALLRPEQHVFYLDRYAGVEELQAQVAALVSQWRAARRELDRMRQDEREIARRVELLRFQVDEIEAARLVPGELDQLEMERRRLANAERLGVLAATIHAALAGDDAGESVGALDTLGAAQHAFGELLRLDDSLRAQEETLEQGMFLLQDVASAIRAYQDEIAADPARQAEVEERLDLLAKLRRKYGATVEEILAYGTEAANELDELLHREERAGALTERELELKRTIGRLSTQLSARRRTAAGQLSAAMERELDELNMRRARFQVQLAQRADPDGAPVPEDAGKLTTGSDLTPGGTYAFGPTGIDQVEFLIAPNQGEPFKPLARIASGGETSRLMLALKSILSRADVIPILIFDEIDAGISGRTGQTVGEKLWQLARAHQVLCVTHLPQIAAAADCHFRVAKSVSAERTTTHVEPLRDDSRTGELAQMLGGASTAISRANAQELLHRAETWKRRDTTRKTAASHSA